MCLDRERVASVRQTDDRIFGGGMTKPARWPLVITVGLMLGGLVELGFAVTGQQLDLGALQIGLGAVGLGIFRAGRVHHWFRG